MKKYDAYKDSGVKWIGEIPNHWEAIKISRVHPIIGSGTTPLSCLLYTSDAADE